MEPDPDRIDDAVLALLSLTIHDESEWGARTWKGHDWDAMNRLHEKGYISNPVSKAKSVVLTPEGLARSWELFEKLFCTNVKLRPMDSQKANTQDQPSP